MKNQLYENALTKQGVQWTYHESILLEDIDAGKGLRNQARLTCPLEEQLVEDYALADKEGSEFPPLVLWRPGKGRWIPVDGNHRLAAKTKNRRKHTDAYVIETQDQLIADRITWSFNNQVNGKRLSREECLEHAVSFVRKYGFTCRNAATEWGLHEAMVNRAVRVANTKDRIAGLGVKVPSNVSDTVISRLHEFVAMGDPVLGTAATLVFKTGISDREVDKLAQDVKECRSEQAKLEKIAQFSQQPEVRQRQAETKGGRVQVPRPLPRNQLQRLLDQVSKLFATYKDRAALRPPQGPEWKAARELAGEVVEDLVTLFGLSALPKEEVG